MRRPIHSAQMIYRCQALRWGLRPIPQRWVRQEWSALGNFDNKRELGRFDVMEEDLPDEVRIMIMHSAKGHD